MERDNSGFIGWAAFASLDPKQPPTNPYVRHWGVVRLFVIGTETKRYKTIGHDTVSQIAREILSNCQAVLSVLPPRLLRQGPSSGRNLENIFLLIPSPRFCFNLLLASPACVISALSETRWACQGLRGVGERDARPGSSAQQHQQKQRVQSQLML